ncbi:MULTISPECIES: hypothetical protein [Bacillus cereus group]|nr:MULTISPECIES: hypothetical protein [Bacillus cereus group]
MSVIAREDTDQRNKKTEKSANYRVKNITPVQSDFIVDNYTN